jgi:hypothetical protein
MIRALDYLNTLVIFSGRYDREHTNAEAFELEEIHMRGLGIGGEILNGEKSNIIPIDFDDLTKLWFETPEEEVAFVLKYPKER